MDPCRNRDPGCCQDTYGVPTYEIEGSALTSAISAPQILNEKGELLLIEVSRLADRFSVWDPQCFEDDQGKPYRKIEEPGENGLIEETIITNDPLWYVVLLLYN